MGSLVRQLGPTFPDHQLYCFIQEVAKKKRGKTLPILYIKPSLSDTNQVY